MIDGIFREVLIYSALAFFVLFWCVVAFEVFWLNRRGKP